MKATNVVSISKGRKQCPYCCERAAELPNGSCRECADDPELHGLIMDTIRRAQFLGIADDTLMEKVEAAIDAAGLGEVLGLDTPIHK